MEAILETDLSQAIVSMIPLLWRAHILKYRPIARHRAGIDAFSHRIGLEVFLELQLKATGTDWVLTGIIFGEIPIDAEGLFEDYGIEGAFSTQ